MNELLTFGEVLLNALQGDKIAREVWIDSDTIDVIYIKSKNNGRPRLKIQYNDGSKARWCPTEEDIFETDWYVVRSKK